MGPRTSLSFLLVLSGIVLLSAIAVGNRMGNHVLGQISQRAAPVPTALLTPVPSVKDRQVSLGWKHTQVVSVATDPAFPDPRVTPAPPAPVQEAPVYHSRASSAKDASLGVQASKKTERHSYTSPPLPIPLATRDGEEAPSEQAETPAPANTPEL